MNDPAAIIAWTVGFLVFIAFLAVAKLLGWLDDEEPKPERYGGHTVRIRETTGGLVRPIDIPCSAPIRENPASVTVSSSPIDVVFGHATDDTR